MSDEMVSVPPNATQAMLDAGYLAIQQGRGAKSVWQVMVAAAPQPAQVAAPASDVSLRALFKSATGYTPEEYEQMLREVKP